VLESSFGCQEWLISASCGGLHPAIYGTEWGVRTRLDCRKCGWIAFGLREDFRKGISLVGRTTHHSARGSTVSDLIGGTWSWKRVRPLKFPTQGVGGIRAIKNWRGATGARMHHST
jgi:hypothetical protein